MSIPVVPIESPNMRTILLALVLALLSLTACTAPVDTPAPLTCPVGQTIVRGTEGPHCIIPGDYVNTEPGCRPLICELLAEQGRHGAADRGNCAAACVAFCEGDSDLEKEALDEAAVLGATCVY